MSQVIETTLRSVYHSSPVVHLRDSDRYVIFSDLHMGDGGPRDEFARNSGILSRVLSRYYLKKKFKLVLNGDVEELYKFSYRTIRKVWSPIYAIFDEFKNKTGLWKMFGNHDFRLSRQPEVDPAFPVLPGLRLVHPAGQAFIFHGHQADPWFPFFNSIAGFILRYIAVPLNIRNYEVPYTSRARYVIERSVLDFSSRSRLISLIGHTHRPLFLSLSKIDFLRFRIEELCRLYLDATPGMRSRLSAETRHIRDLLEEYMTRKYAKEGFFNNPYGIHLHVPSLFNSGCCIGKRGITAIEIRDGRIQLVQWYDATSKPRSFIMNNPEKLPGTRIFRNILNQELLEYVFTKVKLLT